MSAIGQATESIDISLDSTAFNSEGRTRLCNIVHEADERVYMVRLETDLSCVSLEGMNQFYISVTSQHKPSREKQTLGAALEINLRHEMSNVSIAGGSPRYFTVADKSLNLFNADIDDSIHEVVDLGLTAHKIKLGFKPNSEENTYSILVDNFACSLIKASISALLVQATDSHRQVINNAGRLFASRQDYIRDMCESLTGQSENLSTCITKRALQNHQQML